MKNNVAKVTGMVLLFSLALALIAGGWVNKTMVHRRSFDYRRRGWNETAYIEWSPVSNAEGYNVYVKHANAPDSSYQQMDNELIRQYPSYWRADAVGLAEICDEG